MPPFRRPTFHYDYDVDHELEALRDYPKKPDRADRAIPPKGEGRMLLATWNIANLGVQKRRPKDYRLIAEILSWFDMAALQEANDNLAGLRGIQAELPDYYRMVFSDPGGNRERFAFVYDARKVEPLEEVGEVTIPPNELASVKLPDVEQRFAGFDRNPYLGSWRCGDFTFELADVHLYFGSAKDGAAGIGRRCLEAFAVARWADMRRRDAYSYTENILALGDFNLPLRDPSDPVYRALTRRGLHLPEHSTKVGGSNLTGDAYYDQMAVFPGPVQDAIETVGIFDFDGAVFRDLWGETKAQQGRFRSYVKYYLSDHRPLWVELKL
jgi:endonuclease/exonuclease/phosphatase family metal-dependent hydrolase